MKVYPSWRYHKDLGSKIIHSAADEAEDWAESPASFEVTEQINVQPVEIAAPEVIESVMLPSEPEAEVKPAKKKFKGLK